MPLEFLECLSMGRKPPPHRTCHDLESFGLVIIYVLLRRVCFEEKHEDVQRNEARALFELLFGGVALDDIYTGRLAVIHDMSASLAPLDKLLCGDLTRFPREIMSLIEAQVRKRHEDEGTEESFWDAQWQESGLQRVMGIRSVPVPISCENFRVAVENRLRGIFKRRAQMRS